MRGAKRPIPEFILISALVVETGCIICDTLTYHLGGMAAVYVADVPDTLPLNKLVFASDVLFYLGIFLPKACILAFYYSLVPKVLTRARFALWCITVFLAASVLTTFFGLFVSCIPISTNWSTGSDYCGFSAKATFFRIHTALDISCDVMIFVLPFFLIHDLQLKKRQKYTVYGIFSFGAITIAIAIARCITINISPLNTPIYIWAAAEHCCSMIVVCLPSLKPLIKSLSDSISRSAGRSRSKNTWSYFKYTTEKESVKNGVSAFVNASSRDGSQVELRNLEKGILKTSSVTIN